MTKLARLLFLVALFLLPTIVFSQKAYFIDGFHGGIWGHYPVGYTTFIVQQLEKHPGWNINLEIEPETWNRDLSLDLSGINALKAIMADTSVKGRIEYVNPAYGQPYMFNISGESIIRQFAYGMKALRKHFPTLNFLTYSSEEPCFTSAMPQILKSFGYKYASLKNPNTCWGGYTRAHGKELVNWIGPDGTSILTSPRYEIEALKPKSTWETIGNANSKQFINAALADGIDNPVGMCLQDAGWRFGPWLKGNFYRPTSYTTWRNYFENVASNVKASDWNFSQEDVQTSLVWGSQVMQRIAQQVRTAENRIVQAEKMASMQKIDLGMVYPAAAIADAWRSLMLAQHHDCWIVPYNGKKGDTWADKVVDWTQRTNKVADSINMLNSSDSVNEGVYLKVYNTLAKPRNEWINVTLPKAMDAEKLQVLDGKGKVLAFQVIKNGKKLMFKGEVPAFGYAMFELKSNSAPKPKRVANVSFHKNGDCTLETDLYKIHLDKAQGGTVKSLIAKAVDGKEFVDATSKRKFNELRGNFYKKGGFKTNTSKPAKIEVLENGPYLVSVKVESEIAGNPVSQTISLKQGEALIDFDLKINWKENEGIGEFEETNYQNTSLHKAFYNDQYKLLTLFPLALRNQKVFKDAPFDVTESKLENTFFSTWDNIKNNIMLNWVDVLSDDEKYGMAMFTDHTTSYAHGKNFPLGLTTQYSGQGLWGRQYKIDQPTSISYQLMPHKGNWLQSNVSYQNEQIKEPLKANLIISKPKVWSNSFIETSLKSLEVTSCTFDGEDLYLRVFNASKTPNKGSVVLNFNASEVAFVNLNGSAATKAKVTDLVNNGKEVALSLRPFEIATLKISAK